MAQGDTNTSADPLWYKDAVIYELHVKTFCDSDGDGMGDFRGLMEKLDYLRELGVTGLDSLHQFEVTWRSGFEFRGDRDRLGARPWQAHPSLWLATHRRNHFRTCHLQSE